MSKISVDKVVLAYSGGLDTSVILKWLEDEYECEVVTFTADIGQGEELEPARAKAEKYGVKEIYIEDLQEEFVRDFVYPMFRANTVYEGEYLLGTSIARPLIAKRLIEIAAETGADAVSHGATGKGQAHWQYELEGAGKAQPEQCAERFDQPAERCDQQGPASRIAYHKQRNGDSQTFGDVLQADTDS